jgi:nanoRNase/pAp phosphatase (c-di-AMP/oligoRNAs hydrolase)
MYRLVTRSDFDGLVCAMLLKQRGLIDDIAFVHPKDVQDGTVAITAGDITTNLPYRAEAHLVFDHHASEVLRNGAEHGNYVMDADAPSAARVVYEHFGGAVAFPAISADLMAAVDQADSAHYSEAEILEPSGWALLNFLMDPRTGLGRFHHFRISNYDLMMKLIDYCLAHPVEDVLNLPDVAERVELYREQAELFRAQLLACTTVAGEVAESTVSVHVIWGRQKQNTVLAVGKSVLNRSNQVDIGELMLGYGGGGHRNAGTCQLPHARAGTVLAEVVAVLNGVTVGASA